jgi:MFS family permease
MTVTSVAGGRSRTLILAAMIFAVSMTFIDQTIVSIAVPQIQRELGLTSTGMQWAVNAYLLALAALFAFGGRLAETLGHRKMVTLGVIVFAGASALCGLTPKGSLAEAWIVPMKLACTPTTSVPWWCSSSRAASTLGASTNVLACITPAWFTSRLTSAHSAGCSCPAPSRPESPAPGQ